MIDRPRVAAPERDERAALATLSARAIDSLCEAQAVIQNTDLSSVAGVDAHSMQRIARNMRATIAVIARAFSAQGVTMSARPDALNIEKLTVTSARVLRGVTLRQLDEVLGMVRRGTSLAGIDEFLLYGMRHAAMGAYRTISWIEKAAVCTPPISGETDATAFQQAVRDIRDDTGRGLRGAIQLHGEQTPPRGMPAVQVQAAPPTVRMTRAELIAAGLVTDDAAAPADDGDLVSDDAIDRALTHSFSRMDVPRTNALGREG